MARNRLVARGIAWTVGLLLVCASTAAVNASRPERAWLSLCGKCLNPTVVESSGLDTAHAVAVARRPLTGQRPWRSSDLRAFHGECGCPPSRDPMSLPRFLRLAKHASEPSVSAFWAIPATRGYSAGS